ncbi:MULTISPECIES: hypothetical protein [Micrococcales]|uniref:Uncharacterized protein n=2 Tax=Micrococcales TaxID=85006 RepID=A0A2H1KJ02_BREAU|nr:MULTISPECIES: hypothetical protein [Micrococcales]MDN5743446.1 hypothetical protein [Yaniella sp.]AZT94202.1 hypothetical protein CXR23_14470 [Brevibacterium aurantiacum]KAA0972769.1 hypothetical protein FQ154_20335 [Paeniglutamicibacter gangotriensis]RCS91646.1 hypothetical protein CIK61_17785 [Brevibacterium aurantiacum]SMX99518.1 hypothetical protein BAUR9175_03530 [Brevibacterium aurantiacum]
MTPSTRIRTARKVLLVALALGICMVVFAAFIGLGLPGFIISVAGWIALIASLIGFIVVLVQKSTAASRANSWRPADNEEL